MENRIKIYGESVKAEVAKIDAEAEILHAKKWELKKNAVESKKKEFVGVIFYKDHTEDEYESVKTDFEYCKILSVSDYGDFLRVLSIRKLGPDTFTICYTTKSLWNFECWEECTKKEFNYILEEAKSVLSRKK